MAYRDYGTGLGVGVTYGPFEDSPYACCVRVAGEVKQVLVPVGSGSIPAVDRPEDRYLSPEAAARDPEGDANNPFLPANSFIVSARFYAKEAFNAGSAVSLGANTADGTGDNAGFIADVGSAAAGSWIVGSGSFVGNSIGDTALQFNSNTASVDEGYGILIVEYIEPPVV